MPKHSEIPEERERERRRAGMQVRKSGSAIKRIDDKTEGRKREG